MSTYDKIEILFGEVSGAFMDTVAFLLFSVCLLVAAPIWLPLFLWRRSRWPAADEGRGASRSPRGRERKGCHVET